MYVVYSYTYNTNKKSKVIVIKINLTQCLGSANMQ